MGSRSFLTSLSAVMTKSNQISSLELRLLKLSAERQLKHCEGAAQVSSISSQMQAELDSVKAKYGDISSSENQKQLMAEQESIENKYNAMIETIRDHMEEVEEKMDLQQNTVETNLKALRAEYDEWKKLAREKAGRAGYFNNSGG